MGKKRNGSEIYKIKDDENMIDLRIKTNWKWYQVLYLIIGIVLLIRGDLVTLFEWLKSVI